MITIEQLEQLALGLEGDESAQRARLIRLCGAYGRILRVREPHLFQAAACHHGDEAGHFDSSYPPDQVYSERNGPRSIALLDHEVDDIPTETGFYYEWRRATTYGGLRFGRDGSWYRGEETGTGRVGAFAAHPGDCSVDCEIVWSAVEDDDLTLDELRAAEAKLRALAFPLSQEAAA